MSQSQSYNKASAFAATKFQKIKNALNKHQQLKPQ
jgi:hypothetical protein